MVKPEFIGIVAIALLFVLTYPFVFSGTTGSITNTGSDSNQVKVSSNDTTADFLFSKLQAGPNISLTIQNPGGNENILISSTGSGGGGGSGRTYTSGTPATIQVNNDTNTISQNFDGNFNARINALDLNNSLAYAKTDTNCSTSPDCNNLYFKLNPTATQTISGAFDTIFSGRIRAALNVPISIGNSAPAGINDINFYGAFYQANPDIGTGALVFPPQRCAFQITGTESCLDFNNTTRTVGMRDGKEHPFYFWKYGSALSTKGLYAIAPSDILYATWGATEAVDANDLIWYSYGDHRFVQPMIYNPIWGTGSNGWGHITKILFYGTPNNFVNDANHIGDLNHVGSIDLNGNLNLTGNIAGDGEINVAGSILGGGVLSIAGGAQFGSSVDTNYFNSSLGGFFGGDTNFNRVGVSNNIWVDGNVYGQWFSFQAAAGTSCNTICNGWDVNIANLTCQFARTTANVATTCTTTTGARNCLCK